MVKWRRRPARSVCDVILVEAADAPLTRVLDREAGLVTADLHRGHGVDVRLSTSLTAVDVTGDRVGRVTLSDGTELETDVVVVGIGAVPNTDWLEGSGLELDDGVVVDENCRAGDRVVAAGDVARFPNARFGGRMMRVEQWDNAVEMARFAAAGVLFDIDVDIDPGEAGSAQDRPEPFAPVPWFWSDQYDRKIQLAGISADHNVLAQGSLEEHQFVQVYHDGSAVCGVLTWNRPRQAIIGRQLIDQGASVDEAIERLGG